MASLGRSKEKTILFVAIGVVLVSVITISVVGVSKAKARKEAEEQAKVWAERAAAEKEAEEKAEAEKKAAAENAPEWHTVSSETIYVQSLQAISHRFLIPTSTLLVKVTSRGDDTSVGIYKTRTDDGACLNPIIGSETEDEEAYTFQARMPEGTYYLDMANNSSYDICKFEYVIKAYY